MDTIFIFRLPSDPSVIFSPVPSVGEPPGFPMWISLSHWINFFFLILIIRSGLSILIAHPRLYWNDGCDPDTQRIRFTLEKIPIKPKPEATTVVFYSFGKGLYGGFY